MGGTASEEGGKQERMGVTGGKWRATLIIGVTEQRNGSLRVMAGWLCLRGLRPGPVQDTRSWLTL